MTSAMCDLCRAGQVEMLRRAQDAFRADQARVERDSGDVVLAQVVRHARGHLLIGLDALLVGVNHGLCRFRP
jgi:hypothetical protein